MQTSNQDPPPSKERLLHLLAEAAELEHDLLCSYLFSLFSLKESTDEDLLPSELATIDEWRSALLGVCIEEMTHFAQVANITVALGARPHLNRPNIPVGAGYHPASVIVEFTPLDLDTLDHFVFLERPDGDRSPDGASFQTAAAYERRPHHGSLMPSAPDYETIGAFYQVLVEELKRYAAVFGEAALISGAADLQLRPHELHTDSLRVIASLADAVAAVEDIVREGEGSATESDHSHFAMFRRMRDQYRDMLAARADFAASRPVGRNPVMHMPVCDERTHVTQPRASQVLDCANATYGLMLRFLAQCYETPWACEETRARLVGGCVSSMKLLSLLGRRLTLMDAAQAGAEGDAVATKAGVSFAMLRSLQGWSRPQDAIAGLAERATEITAALQGLDVSPEIKLSGRELLNGWTAPSSPDAAFNAGRPPSAPG